MYGCYLTSDDNKFLDVITDELDKYNLSTDSSLCVSFFPFWYSIIFVLKIIYFLFFLIAVFFFFLLYHHEIDCYCIVFGIKIIQIYSVSLSGKKKLLAEQSFVWNHNLWMKQMCKNVFSCFILRNRVSSSIGTLTLQKFFNLKRRETAMCRSK